MKPYILIPTFGTIPSDKIVGRELEIEKLKSLLEANSIELEDLRRMGKTLLLKKFAYLSVLNDEPIKAIYFTFQGTKNVTELTDVILDALRIEENNGWLKVQMNKLKQLYNKVTNSNIEVKHQDISFSFKLPAFHDEWKKAFALSIEDIADRQNGKNEMLVLIFDELPMMLWEWIKDNREQEAMEFLNLMRNIRQTLEDNYPNRIRFIYCGSIGMNIVLKKLKDDFKYVGEAFNDTEKFVLPPMSNEDALFLCECLFISGFKCDKKEAKNGYFTKISRYAENIPFFINNFFMIIKNQENMTLSEISIENALQKTLTEKGKHEEIFSQLSSRLEIYYPEEDAKIARKCLNILSKSDSEMEESLIMDALKLQDENKVQDVLYFLWKDEYLRRTIDENGIRKFSFKYNLFKNWWKLNKA
jgi:hypothetical protein